MSFYTLHGTRGYIQLQYACSNQFPYIKDNWTRLRTQDKIVIDQVIPAIKDKAKKVKFI